jgi:hypothetical protein
MSSVHRELPQLLATRARGLQIPSMRIALDDQEIELLLAGTAHLSPPQRAKLLGRISAALTHCAHCSEGAVFRAAMLMAQGMPFAA